MTIAARFRPLSPNLRAILGLSRYLTPRRYRKGERWVAALPDFTDVHRSIAQDQHRYLDQPRSNYARPRGAWLRALPPSEAYLLSGANMEARVAFAETALRHLRRHGELYREPLHFVTVSPAAYVRPFETASRTNLLSLRKLTGQALSGTSFVGAPDFALFKAWGISGIRGLHNHVGPHTHNIVFGASREQIEQAMLDAGLDRGGWSGGRAFHIKEITSEKLEGYLLYLLKAPLFFYHAKKGVRLFRKLLADETETHSLFKAYPLRPGDQLRMGAVIHEMYLDELLFGQGLGTPLVRDICNEARDPLRRLNEVAKREGRAEVSLAVSVKADSRPLLSACIREPVLQRLISRLSKRRSTSNGPFDPGRFVPRAQRHDPELDDLDG